MADRSTGAARTASSTKTAEAGLTRRKKLRALSGSARGAAAGALTLDRVIHERMRLAIVSALSVHDSLTFNALKAILDTTDGNLSVHARKLEEAGYLVCNKSFEGRLPRTEYSLTPDGRRALDDYLNHMEAIIRQVGK